MKLVYPAIFSPLEEKKGYCVTFPDLPGAVTEGDTLADALEMAVNCAGLWVLDELEDGNEVPKASEPSNITLESKDDFINLIVLDVDAYAEKYGQKAIRKNCTIPAWLNTISEKEHLNYSAILQEALIEKLHLNF
ncbi:MAG: type II toxin-antitoxin system HicB family antitoxin [Ruminococcus sp.]|nr:type II toxin-antitoxin system HicB family antitoxin [Ruminococcus sp.]